MTQTAQVTSTILMIRPVAFRMNEQTAVNNYYQKAIEGLTPEEIQSNALGEFDDYVKKLRNIGVNVVVIDDTAEPSTPDSIFPNNWISFHQDGVIGLYPMFAENRRLERRHDIIEKLVEKGFEVTLIADLTNLEEQGIFLEGTGSMVLDRENKLVYAALSERTSTEALDKFCDMFDYRAVVFHSFQTVDKERLPIYHTNVMMCVAREFAIICLDSIDDNDERNAVLEVLKNSGKEVIEISEEQINQFAGNMLQVAGDDKEYLIMSTAAYKSLSNEQIQRIENYCPIVHSSLDTIEALGGGSARCMMAEVFLPRKN